MQDISQTLWADFITSFQKNIAKAETTTLSKLKSVNQRKYFFKNDLLPLIADDLNLFYDNTKEFLRIDHTFFKKGSMHDWHIPMIFIESENSWTTSYEEALKLCSVNAPLKILIQYELTDLLAMELEERETNWDYIFDDYIHERGLTGYFALLVYIAQNEESVTFKKVLYNEKGQIIENGNIIINLNPLAKSAFLQKTKLNTEISIV